MESSGTKKYASREISYPRTEPEHLGDLGCILSVERCINLPCVKDAAAPRGLWPLEKRRKKSEVTRNVAEFASSYTQGW